MNFGIVICEQCVLSRSECDLCDVAGVNLRSDSFPNATQLFGRVRLTRMRRIGQDDAAGALGECCLPILPLSCLSLLIPPRVDDLPLRLVQRDEVVHGVPYLKRSVGL